jgi:hypothetical protein
MRVSLEYAFEGHCTGREHRQCVESRSPSVEHTFKCEQKHVVEGLALLLLNGAHPNDLSLDSDWSGQLSYLTLETRRKSNGKGRENESQDYGPVRFPDRLRQRVLRKAP